MWSVPGGHMEYKESPEDTAQREAFEELGIIIKNQKVVGITNYIMENEEKHYITIFVESDFEGEPIMNEPDKTSECGWFAIDTLPKPLFTPLKNFFENKRIL